MTAPTSCGVSSVTVTAAASDPILDALQYRFVLYNALSVVVSTSGFAAASNVTYTVNATIPAGGYRLEVRGPPGWQRPRDSL